MKTLPGYSISLSAVFFILEYSTSDVDYTLWREKCGIVWGKVRYIEVYLLSI